MSAGPCPCGSGKKYAVCCGPLHAGKDARTCEQLMRSRYSAYVLRLETYLLHTWHPYSRPDSLNLRGDQTRWLGLKIHSREDGGPGDGVGWVTFSAHYRLGEEVHTLVERSEFVRMPDERWVYLNGE
ncbi:YchJ family protein [Deinococcus sp.]|uniref:YchJ family protein n=1 Tax=Deinococcus sp. TaxID=47478 RepID=UPI003CC6D830